MTLLPVVELLAGSVDYAGLFPPASLALDQVVTNYAAYLRSPQRWMLGRLIIPWHQLSTLENASREYAPRGGPTVSPWRISCLLPPPSGGTDIPTMLAALTEFNRPASQPDRQIAVIDAIEVRIDDTQQIDDLAANLPEDLETFLEVPAGHAATALMGKLAGSAKGLLRAKIRTGGIQPQLIPSPAALARFIAACVTHGVPFKATAGLHHPVRGPHPLTAAADAPSGTLHGFLNLLLASGFLVAGKLTENDAIELLCETDPQALRADQHGWYWRDLHLTTPEIAAARQRGLRSFGSCSFDEPVEDLRGLGFLLE